MEAIHGVDTSWLHKPLSRTNSSQVSPAVTPPLKPSKGPKQEKQDQPTRPRDIPQSSQRDSSAPPSGSATTATPPSRSSSVKRPGFLGRTSSADKTPTKSSWMSSISSKFSSSSQAPSPIATADAQKQAKSGSIPSATKSPVKASASPTTSSDTRGSSKDEEVLEPYVPQAPKKEGSGFLSGALRRLSSSSGSQPKTAASSIPQGVVVPRMTLNIDKERERCKIKELNQGKLKRVAFNVDVEVAGVSNYIAEDDTTAFKDKKISARGEGEALKHPELADVAEGAGSSSRSGGTGMWSSMSMTEDDWTSSTPPKSPKGKDGKDVQQKEAAKSSGALQKTAPKTQVQNQNRNDDDHDILRHLSGMEDDWGGGVQGPVKQRKKSRSGSGAGFYDSLTLDEDDFTTSGGRKSRSEAAPSRRRSSDRSTEGRRDMMALLANDDWSDQADSPAKGGSPAKRSSPSKGSPAGPVPETPDAEPSPRLPRSPRSPRQTVARTQSTPAPVSIGQAAMAPPEAVQVTPQAGPVSGQQLAPPQDASSRGGSISPSSERPQDKPTTDPLRIYRRCCQLREAPVLKRISEQLQKPGNFSDGIVGTLNLNKSRMQPGDVVGLADWLSIVPVKHLLIEDANLTDDSLRQILSGLLSTKTPEVASRRRGKSSPTRRRGLHDRDNPGVIEKISLRGNRKFTEEGWKYLCVFLNMSKSIKSVDLSLVPFPKPITDVDPSARTIDDLLCKALVESKAGRPLQELLMSDCGLNSQQVERITRAASHGTERLGLANNHLNAEGLNYVARYLKSGHCRGIDLGGNDLRNKVHILADAVVDPLLALSIANCNLLPADLERLLPTLSALPDLRFLDISHNKDLFSTKYGAATLAVLRKYIPRFKLLKRFHIADVSLDPEQAIHIAEILPECRNLAHINMLENPSIKAVISDGANQAHQEEACALFASLMTAARLSKTLVAVDIDIPGRTASEVVKALARQVVAYCLRNIEAFTEADAGSVADAAAALPDIDKSNDSGIALLQHFVGHQDMSTDDANSHAATEDYYVGGTGVVKALSYILSASQKGDLSNVSMPGTPSKVLESELGKAQAKDMSKTLLESARKYRTGLQPVLVRESNANNVEVLRRLTFVDDTLRGIIERFEEEYPETRPSGPQRINTSATVNQDFVELASPARSRASSVDSINSRSYQAMGESYASDAGSFERSTSPTTNPGTWRHTFPFSNEAAGGGESPQGLSRRESQVDLHNRELVTEEGKMHRISARLRKEIFKPNGQDDYLHRTTAGSVDPEHLAALREKYYAFGGDEIRQLFIEKGMEAAIRDIANDAEMLRNLELTDPDGFRKYREAHQLALETGALASEPETDGLVIGGGGGRARGRTY